ncbi:MAG TPA: hypothetical protein VNH65_09375 [Candidatus Acidoferrum sp.]|nr:hypothetical protein [Candidatus Acidoferrum sp.]
MKGTQRLLATAMAVFLANVPGRAKPDALGIVVQADRASLDAQAVFEGTTVFDGDRLSTGAGGALRLGIGEAMLDLTADSSVVVHSNAGKIAKALEMELLSGTVVLSEPAEGRAKIVASSARVRPVAETRGVVQVAFVGPRELIVFARRGPAQIFFQGESATVAEGKCYRVLMNASADGAAGDQNGKKSAKRGKALVLIAVGAAVVVGIIIWRETRGEESPDRP